jgi:acyl-CoA hydrolase
MLTSQVQIIMPSHVNGVNRLFGGELMAWIDMVGAVEARRHTHRHVTTAVVDNLNFLGPAFLDDTVRLDARVTWTGKTSIEVRVDTFIERLSGGEDMINRAYIVYVALDAEGRPAEVAPFSPETPEEKDEWKAAEKRREIRLAQKSSR